MEILRAIAEPFRPAKQWPVTVYRSAANIHNNGTGALG